MSDIRIGLALGSGAARGWAHIGVLKALAEMGIVPDLIAGTSVGALVGGAYLTGQLERLQDWARTLGFFGIVRLLDVTFSKGGLVTIEKVFELFRNERTDLPIERLDRPFAAVATELATGREVWLRDGPLLDAVRASAAMPGLFPAVPNGGRWLVDGALVNPVPVSLCRAMGATVVIAVNLNSELATLPRLSKNGKQADKARSLLAARVASAFGERGRSLRAGDPKLPSPSVLEVLAGSLDIMQDRITRARLAGDPADVVIAPRLGHVGVLDFDRGEELIEVGRTATEAMRPAIDLAIRRT